MSQVPHYEYPSPVGPPGRFVGEQRIKLPNGNGQAKLEKPTTKEPIDLIKISTASPEELPFILSQKEVQDRLANASQAEISLIVSVYATHIGAGVNLPPLPLTLSSLDHRNFFADKVLIAITEDFKDMGQTEGYVLLLKQIFESNAQISSAVYFGCIEELINLSLIYLPEDRAKQLAQLRTIIWDESVKRPFDQQEFSQYFNKVTEKYLNNDIRRVGKLLRMTQFLADVHPDQKIFFNQLAINLIKQTKNYHLWKEIQLLMTDPEPGEDKSEKQSSKVSVQKLAKGITGVYDHSGRPVSFAYDQEITDEAPLNLDAYNQDPPNNDPVSDGYITSDPRLHLIRDLRLFVPGSDQEAPHSWQRLESINEFQYFIRLPMRRLIEKDFEIDFSELEIQVQQYFLNYLNKANGPEVISIYRNIREHGVNFLTTFLSLEEESLMGYVVQEILQSHPPETAEKIFAKYRELFEAAEQVRSYLQENFADQLSANPGIGDEIIKQLLKKGKDILIFAASEDSEKINITEYMEEYKVELQFFAAVFRTLRSKGEKLELEDFNKTSIEIKAGAAIDPKDKQEMRRIADLNWSDKEPVLHRAVMTGFEEALADPANRFYIFKYGGELMAFIRFDPMGATELYAGSLNTRTEIRGANIGEAALNQALKEESVSHLIKATVWPKLPMTSRYIGEFGFIGSNVIANYLETGEEFFELERSQQNNRYQLFQKTYEDLLTIHQDTDGQWNKEGTLLVWGFDYPRDYKRFLAFAEQVMATRPGYVLTAYVRDRKVRGYDDECRIMVGFEKRLPPNPADNPSAKGPQTNHDASKQSPDLQ